MTNLIVVLSVLVAMAAAVRSTWSPCGLSMLSSITPLAEQGRGYRFRSTALWFVCGSVLGGLVFGIVAAGLAAVVGLAGLSTSAALGLGAVLALAAGACDLGVLGPPIPHLRRQVNELWLSRYRSWVYGAGFGLQIGVGVGTYIMTAAVYLTAALAALTGSPLVAVGIGFVFGLTRGLAIFMGVGITSTDAALSFHRRFDALAEPVRRVVIGVQLVVAIVAAGAAWGIVGSVPVALVAAALVALVVSRHRAAAHDEATTSALAH